jgi:hypothetical protein
MCPLFWDLLSCRLVIGARYVRKRFSHIAKDRIVREDVGLLDRKLFLENPAISHPLTSGPTPKQRPQHCWKSLKPGKLMSLKLLHRTRQSRAELKN